MKRNESKRYLKPGEFGIVEFQNPSGGTAYRVTGWTMNGERVRQNFKTHADALSRKEQLETESKNLIVAGNLVRTTLTQEQINDAHLAFEELGRAANIKDKSILGAVRFFIENYREPVRPMTVAQAYDEFISAKERDGLRERSVANLRSRVGLLKNKFGTKLVSEILPQHIGELIGRPGSHRSQLTRTNDRLALSAFFAWCMEPERGYCASNPAKKTSRTRRANGNDLEPKVFTLEESRELIEQAARFKRGKLVPYIALGLFAGIRPAELARLTWDCIDLQSGTVTLGAGMAKMRSRRIVEMVKLAKLPANLIQWLAPHAKKRTPIVGPNWRKDFDAVKRFAGWSGRESDGTEGLKPWTEDLMRHTAISNYFAQFHDEGKAAEWAGNSPNVIHKHYRGLVKSTDATEFWNIRPN